MKKLFYAKNGFTLSEVLITLGVIGVVAAMTLHALVNQYQEKVTVTKLKKIYAVLSQAYLFSVQEYGTPDNWGLTGRDSGDSQAEEYIAHNAINIRDKLLKNVNKLKTCNNAKKMTDCGVAGKYYYRHGGIDGGITSTSSQSTAVASIDGSTIMLISNSGPEGENRGKKQLKQTYSIIYVDVNGIKPPNTWGTDLFGFYLTKQDIVPIGTDRETYYPFDTSCYNNGLGCTIWVIQNENLEYLKCKNLKLNGKKKC